MREVSEFIEALRAQDNRSCVIMITTRLEFLLSLRSALRAQDNRSCVIMITTRLEFLLRRAIEVRKHDCLHHDLTSASKPLSEIKSRFRKSVILPATQ